MKKLLTIATLLACGLLLGVANGQTMPPVIVVRLKASESQQLTALNKSVMDAQIALYRAKFAESKAENKIMNAHRTKEIGPDPGCVSGLAEDRPTGYSAKIVENWIIVYTRNIPHCQGDW